MKENLKVGIIGATGMVGQQLVRRLDGHPWFTISALAASSRSAGRRYSDLMQERWKMDTPLPESVMDAVVIDASDIEAVAAKVDFVFCAVDLGKDEILKLEEAYARAEIPVISNNSANRWTPDVPMIIPEINPEHSDVIKLQRRRLNTERGFIAVKPNCSIQSYVPALHALKAFNPQKVIVSNYQAISGAGKRFSDWPEMVENLIPHIGGEEAKSETEPLKIWGTLTDRGIEAAASPVISAQCYRVAVADGHTSSVAVQFEKKPEIQEILDVWAQYRGVPQELKLPSAPDPFLQYFNEPDRPQPKLDVNISNGMAVALGRLRDDSIFDYKFTCLSHNTLRGAAGGSILTAELLMKQGFLR